MKIFSALALTLSVFSVASALPVASPDVGGLIQSLTGGLDSLSRGAAPIPESSSFLPGGSPAPASTAAPALLKKRLSTHVDSVIDAIVKINTEVVVKALLKLRLDVCSDIHAKIHLAASGLLTTDTDVVIPKISARVNAATDAAVNAKIDLDANLEVLSKIHLHAKAAILEVCPQGDDACMIKNVLAIVAKVEALVELDVARLFIALKANLMTHVRAKVQVVIRELGLNLLVEKINVVGFVDAVADVDLHLDLCAHVIVNGLNVTVLANAPAAIIHICAA